MEETKKKPKYNMWQNTGWMVKQALKYLPQVPFTVVCGALLAVVVNLTELFIAPVILRYVETEAPLTTLLTAILLFTLALSLLSAAMRYSEEAPFCAYISLRSKIIVLVQQKIMTMSYPMTQDPEIRAHMNKTCDICSSNTEATEEIWRTLRVLLRDLLGFVIYLCLLVNVDPVLLAVTVITATLGYFASKRSNEWLYHHRDEESALEKRLGYMKWNASDRKLGKDVRIFGMGPWLKDIYASALKLYLDFAVREQREYLKADLIDLVMSIVRNSVAYWYLISMTLREGLPASQFLLYFTAIGGFTAWVTGILSGFSKLHKQCLDLSTLREFLELPEPFRFADGKPLPLRADGKYTLELKNVTFRYPGAEKDTLSNVNLTIPAGEKLAIVGLNGAGKTTLVKLLCGLYDPTEGAVLLNGEDIRQFNRNDYYEHFSAVFQQFALLDVTMAENVAQTFENIDMARVKNCIAKAGLTEKIESLPKGYHTILGREVYFDGVELSGGETQRLMLARALYKSAPIIVLDEPTAALDPLAEQDIYMKYNEMTAGRTALYISHRLASTRFCDRILFVADGGIAEEGTHESLLAAGGRYAELFAVQSKYYQEGGEQNEKA